MHFAAAITVAYALASSWRAALSIGMIGPQVQTAVCVLPGRGRIRAPGRKLRPDYRSRLTRNLSGTRLCKAGNQRATP